MPVIGTGGGQGGLGHGRPPPGWAERFIAAPIRRDNIKYFKILKRCMGGLIFYHADDGGRVSLINSYKINPGTFV